MVFRTNALGIFQEDHWYIWRIYLITAFDCPIFQRLGRKQNITLRKPVKDPKFPQDLRPIILLSTTGKLFEKVILKIVQRHIEERGILNASQFGLCVRHSITLQCMRLTDHVTLNFNKHVYGCCFLGY
jgi:hypothetical protein